MVCFGECTCAKNLHKLVPDITHPLSDGFLAKPWPEKIHCRRYALQQ